MTNRLIRPRRVSPLSSLIGLLGTLVLAVAVQAQPTDSPYLVRDIDLTGEPYSEGCILSVCPPPILYYGSRLSQFFPLGDRLIFSADDRQEGIPAWVSDGTTAGTQRLRDDAVSSPTTLLGAAGDRFLLWTDDLSAPLWSTQGIPGDDISVTLGCPDCGVVSRVATFDESVYFQVYDPSIQHYSLWRSDGLTAEQVDNLCGTPGFCLERVQRTLTWDGDLYYDHWFPGHPRRIFSLESSTSSPVEVEATCGWEQGLVAAGPQLLFSGSCYDAAANLYRNGVHGTPRPGVEPQLIRSIASFAPGTTPTVPLAGPLTGFGSDPGFGAFTVGEVLWLTDGTLSGTQPTVNFDSIDSMVGLGNVLLVSGRRNGNPGIWSLDTSGMVEALSVGTVTGAPQVVSQSGAQNVTAQAMFAMDQAMFGVEPWITDGTASGTRRLGDIRPGAASSAPGIGGLDATGFVSAGDTVYFGADDGEHDVELWAVDLSATQEPSGCTPSARVLCLADGRFSVEVEWRDFAGIEGFGTAIPMTFESGAFWFFEDVRFELIVKIVDGRDYNGHFWVFHGSLTNVEYNLTVTDTTTGATWTRLNQLQEFGSDGDTEAFPDPLLP
ncbi:MAG: hypothetical protein K8J08_10905 [Thermoanaerobaculia bacterium]|nr:hypothetical protein [Thermoanaerobaculia bacterium]